MRVEALPSKLLILYAFIGPRYFSALYFMISFTFSKQLLMLLITKGQFVSTQNYLCQFLYNSKYRREHFKNYFKNRIS